MRFELGFVIMLLMLFAVRATADYQIEAVPKGYNLYAYDDCGVAGRQPHIDLADCYNFTFALSDTDADLKARSAVFSYKEIRINYTDIDPKLTYALALTYATDHVYKRVQSLWAGDIELHGPIPLPNGKAINVYVNVPPSAIQDGKLSLKIRIHGEVNATVSAIELWSSGVRKDKLKLSSVAAIPGGLTGRLEDMTFAGTEGTTIELRSVRDDKVLASTVTDKNGYFTFDDKLWRDRKVNEDLHVVAKCQDENLSQTISASELNFEATTYRPLPVMVDGLKSHEIKLNGVWKIDPTPADSVRDNSLTAKSWADINVPGQWLQQGFDIPQDKHAAMAKEFTIPKEWADYRIFLRFDAIHAGTNYWLNGKKLGYSENLFTPVEWDITDAALVGQTNRLDLDMKVETASERLSFSSGYAFHNLGGIDRAVRIYALPKVHVKNMRLLTDLDSAYKDAEMKLNVTLDNSTKPANGLALHVTVLDANGKAAQISKSSMPIKSNEPVDMTVKVINPLKWTAEKPHLYKMVLELKSGGSVIERIERNIGFRKIEIRGKQVYINGQRVKFAGACHHEFDPLTGRADAMRHAEQDVKLIKDSNLNYLRTSHYPPTQELLDAADRLGVYVECEAPFCWVGPSEDLNDLKAILTPTSAMVDYCHTHPSIVMWSIANESSFNKTFEFSNKLIKKLDPTRITTFNNPDLERICDTVNWHYPPMPYSDKMTDDPRPLLFGEYWFPVCHEQTDVSINPGLRELWGHGQAEPDSAFAKDASASYDQPIIMPGARAGSWSTIYHSKSIFGGAIWAEIDEPFYFQNGTHCGFAWHHGFWGLYDAWRRPKPEAELAKLIFSPVWFPVRQIAYSTGQESVTISVENRYSFTNLRELAFTWEIGKKKGKVKTNLAPGKTGDIKIPIPMGTGEGTKLTLRVSDSEGKVINVLNVALGKEKQAALPQPKLAPEWHDDGEKITVKGNNFGLVMNIKTAMFDTTNPAHKAPIMSFPILHITRHDYGDLNGPNSPPYEVLPDPKTREIEGVGVGEQLNGVEIRIKDHYDKFDGTVIWLIDKNGVGKVSYDYTYLGDESIDAREIGISMLLQPRYDELKWKRWSEWGDVFPKDCISRTEGSAKSRRSNDLPDVAETVRPAWPWSLDQTELGTADFRSIKFNIYEASLVAPDGSGVRVNANADAHIRASLAKDGVKMHLLKQCPIGRVLLKKDDHLTGEFTVSLCKQAGK